MSVRSCLGERHVELGNCSTAGIEMTYPVSLDAKHLSAGSALIDEQTAAPGQSVITRNEAKMASGMNEIERQFLGPGQGQDQIDSKVPCAVHAQRAGNWQVCAERKAWSQCHVHHSGNVVACLHQAAGQVKTCGRIHGRGAINLIKAGEEREGRWSRTRHRTAAAAS